MMFIDNTNTQNKNFNDFISSLNNDAFTRSSLISYLSPTNEIDFYSALNVLKQAPATLFYYSIPEQDFSLVASGEEFSKSFSNIEMLDKYFSEFKELEKRAVHNFNSFNYYPPLFFFSAKFPSKKFSEEWGNFDSVKLFIPELTLISCEGKYFSVMNFIHDSSVEEMTDKFRSRTESLQYFSGVFNKNISKPAIKLFRSDSMVTWENKVEKLLNGIRNNEYEKVVLSRSTEFNILSDIELPQLAVLLDEKYPECYNIIYKVKNAMFFSASPEKLFILNNGDIHTEALAGSIERGNNEQQDKSLESVLIKSSKDIQEHAFVIDHIRKVLIKYCQNVFVDSSPSLKKLSNIQHLHTALSGRLKNGIDLFSMIKDIFPTPAVGGNPVIPALKIIDDIEDFDRGLFTGFIGWLNLKNDGEFIVSIRSGLIINDKLHVYSGCGIVPGSDPKKEYEETRLKAETIISLFNYENKS